MQFFKSLRTLLCITVLLPLAAHNAHAKTATAPSILPAYTYQMLLGPDGGALTRNGMKYQGRLTFTTTTTGAWSGKLEWFTLTQAVNGNGQLSDYTFGTGSSVWIPVLVNYPLTGKFVAAGDGSASGKLSATISIPTTKGSSGHTLSLELSAPDASQLAAGGALAKPFGVLPSAPYSALKALATLHLDQTFGETSTFKGSGFAVTKGMTSAKGQYRSMSFVDGVEENNHSHTYDYNGAALLTYTFQTGSGSGKLLSTAHVGLDGAAPLLTTGPIKSFKISYTNAANKSATASMDTGGMLAFYAKIELVSGETRKFEISEAEWVAGGYILERNLKFPGGHVLRDEWSNDSALVAQVGRPWGILTKEVIGRTKRYVDFDAAEKIQAGKVYDFEIVCSDVNETWTDQVTFNANGVASFKYKSAAAKALGISLTTKPASGAFAATMKFKYGFLDAGGRLSKTTGFAMPGGDLLGWGAIEGGDIGFRIRKH